MAEVRSRHTEVAKVAAADIVFGAQRKLLQLPIAVGGVVLGAGIIAGMRHEIRIIARLAWAVLIRSASRSSLVPIALSFNFPKNPLLRPEFGGVLESPCNLRYSAS